MGGGTPLLGRAGYMCLCAESSLPGIVSYDAMCDDSSRWSVLGCGRTWP